MSSSSLSDLSQDDKGSSLGILKSKKFLQIVLLTIIVVVISGGALLYVQSHAQKKVLAENTNASAQEIETLLNKIGQSIELPQNESPTIATVTDITKLEGQAFFKNAKNGDKVIIFMNAKKAILYRPSTEKIIDVSPIAEGTNLANAAGEVTQEGAQATVPSALPPVPKEKVKVTILNGSKEAGLTKKAQAELDDSVLEVAGVGNTKGDYAMSVISIVSKENTLSNKELLELVKPISKVKFEVKELPDGETAINDASVVIILGEDFASAY